jgi:hypothetical protein
MITAWSTPLISFQNELVWHHFKFHLGPEPAPLKMSTELSSRYSARKAITLIVKVANAGGAHMILVVFTVCLVLSA